MTIDWFGLANAVATIRNMPESVQRVIVAELQNGQKVTNRKSPITDEVWNACSKFWRTPDDIAAELGRDRHQVVSVLSKLAGEGLLERRKHETRPGKEYRLKEYRLKP